MKFVEGTKVRSKNFEISFEGTICGIVAEQLDSEYKYIVKIEKTNIDHKVYPYSCIAIWEMYLELI